MKKVNVTVVSDTKNPKKFLESEQQPPKTRRERLAREALTTSDVIPFKKK